MKYTIYIQYKIIFVFLGIIFFSNLLYSQVSLLQFPKNLQLYKRSTVTNLATIPISGSVTQGLGYTNVTLEVYKNSVLVQSITQILSYNTGVAMFGFNPTIEAELSNFDFKLLSNTGIVLANANNVVAGDIFIFQGQSNSIRHNYPNGVFPYQNNFIRSYLSSNNWSTNPNPFVFGGIGYWFAEQIVLNNNIPICILNGGEGGKPIDYFQRNDSNIYDNTTNYGRLLQRFTNAGFVAQDVKAIIWYQGEANGGGLSSYYQSQFSDLYADWSLDFSPQKYYVFQLHKGCGVSSPSELPNLFRNFPLLFTNLQTISTNGAAQGTDNCHYYNTNGYNVLAERLYNLVAYDFYNSANSSGIYSPNISNVRFSNPSKNQIKFDLFPNTDTFTWQTGVENDFWIEGSTVTVINGSVLGNTVTLNLSSNVTDSNPKLSYLGHNPDDTPFIINQNGIGMLSFKEVNIQNNALVSVLVGNWTYYYYENDLVHPILGVEHNPTGGNTQNFTLDIIYSSNTTPYSSKVLKEGVFSFSDFWNITKVGSSNGWVNIRLFHNPNSLLDLQNSATTFATTNGSLHTSPLLYIQTQQEFDPTLHLNPNGLNISFFKSGNSNSSGVYNSNNYTELQEVTLSGVTGITIIKKVTNLNDLISPGTIRYNSSNHKFQGFTGIRWVDFH